MSSLSKVILVLGKARRHRAPTLGCREAESPGWFDALQKNCTRHDVWMVTLSWWRWQSLVAHSHGLLNHPNSFYRVIFALKLNAKFDAYPLLYCLSHFECDSHTVHMLSQWCLPPLLTTTVKSSLFTHTHSSPCSLAAMLQLRYANCFCYSNNGWNFSKLTS